MQKLETTVGSGVPIRTSVSDPYVLRRASQQAAHLVLTAGFRWDEWEDFRQELLLDLLRRTPQFNAARSDWRAFVRGVLRNQAIVLANRRRRFNQQEVLFEDLPETTQMRIHERFITRNIKAEFDNRLHVRGVVAGLPRRMQEIVSLLSQYTIPEVCAKTGRSRSEVYRTIEKARSHFTRCGFQPSTSRRPVGS
jgi:DNA-directed RNA polymerase specialized sigma24 family protein